MTREDPPDDSFDPSDFSDKELAETDLPGSTDQGLGLELNFQELLKVFYQVKK